MSNAHITQYQVLLLDPPRVSFLKTAALNSATLLPDGESSPLHDLEEILTTLTSLRSDLKDIPVEDPDKTLYTDGSSFIEDGVR